MELENIIRENTPTSGVYRYIAPKGFHFESHGINFGNIIWDGNKLSNPYTLEKDNEEI